MKSEKTATKRPAVLDPRRLRPSRLKLGFLGRGWVFLSWVFLSWMLLGCEDDPGKPTGTDAVASALALRSPLTQPAPSAAIGSAEPIDTSKFIQRPRSDSELVLTDKLRSDIETAFPKAKGFIDARTIEAKLIHADIPRGKESKAIEMFDAAAKGKWVLFAGHLANPTEKGFQFGVRYTPRDPRDELGVTAVFFMIDIDDIEGYDKGEYDSGDLVAVLAQYQGKAKAGPGHDLVLLRHWSLEE